MASCAASHVSSLYAGPQVWETLHQYALEYLGRHVAGGGAGVAGGGVGAGAGAGMPSAGTVEL